jgi:type IV secretion system protein VirB10
MSPANSPAGLFPSKAGNVTRINRKAVAGVSLFFAVAMLYLIFEILTRGGDVESASDRQTRSVRKAEPAAVPTELGAPTPATPQESGGLVSSVKSAIANAAPGNSSASSVNDSDLAKEQAEYAREIRRYEHQQYMQKLSKRDAALTAGMEPRGVSPASVAEARTADIQQGAEDGSVATLQRLPGGQLALGGGDALGGELGSLNRDPNMQGRKESFFGQEKASGYLAYRKEAPQSPYEVKQGTVVPGVMISGINSDLPGQILAQVSQNVFDSVTGEHLLIPQGTKIVGSYDSFVAVGQERAMVAWRRLIFPDGMSLELLNMPGADQGGYAGFQDQVNNHYFKIFGGAIMMSFLGAGFQLSQPQNNGQYPTAREIIAAETGRNIAQVGVELTRRNMAVQPTIEIRPGYRFNIMINKDMILEPYREE